MKDSEGEHSEHALKQRLMAADCEQAPEAKVVTTTANAKGIGYTSVTVDTPMEKRTVPIIDASEEAMQRILMDGLWDSIKRMFFPVKPKPPLPIFYVVPNRKRKKLYHLVDATGDGTTSSKFELWDSIKRMFFPVKPKPPLPIFYVVPTRKRKKLYHLVDATVDTTKSAKFELWEYVNEMIDAIDHDEASLVMTLVTSPLIRLVDVRHVTKEEMLVRGFNMYSGTQDGKDCTYLVDVETAKEGAPCQPKEEK